MSLEVSGDPAGASFEVRVMPRTQPEGVGGERGGRLVVRVGAAPVDGQANQAVERLLAKVLGTSRGAVSIVAGQRARNKRVVVSGLTPAEVRQRLHGE